MAETVEVQTHDITAGFQIRFSGSGPQLSFVEVEDLTGHSIRIGRWERDDEDGCHLLIVDPIEGEDEEG